MFVTIAGGFMPPSPITALTAALDGCAVLDLVGMSDKELRSMVVELRVTATRLEVEIARVVHAAEQAEVWRPLGRHLWRCGWRARRTPPYARRAIRFVSRTLWLPHRSSPRRCGTVSCRS